MSVANDAHGTPPAAASYFRALEIDDDPALLQASYEMRYQVYCLERQFLSPSYYPLGAETDVFDQHAVHLGEQQAVEALGHGVIERIAAGSDRGDFVVRGQALGVADGQVLPRFKGSSQRCCVRQSVGARRVPRRESASRGYCVVVH